MIVNNENVNRDDGVIVELMKVSGCDSDNWNLYILFRPNSLVSSIDFYLYLLVSL